MADGRQAVSLIAPLSARSRAEEVVQRVSQAIQLGLISDGDQLPPEAEFAAQLGVSAMTLREALAVLRQQGLVETRRGRTGGTFVRRPAAPQPSVLRDRLRAMTGGELRDLTDEQSAVFGAAARLAATRASTVSVRRLLTLADQLSTAATPAARIMADSRFHIEVALASKSERLTALEVALQATVAELLWFPFEADDAAGRPAKLPAPLSPELGLRESVPQESVPQESVPQESVPLDRIALDRIALDRIALDSVGAGEEHAAIAAAIEAEDGPRARLLAEDHVAANLRRLTWLRRALSPQP